MDDQDGPPWARKYQGMALPWDYSLGKVGGSMSNVKIIIGKSLQVSSDCPCRGLAGHSRAPSQRIAQTPRKHVSPQIVDKAIELQAAANIFVDMRDLMRKMMVTITSDPTPDSLLSALDSVVSSLHCCDVTKDTEVLDVKREPAPTYSSRAHSRARSRSF